MPVGGHVGISEDEEMVETGSNGVTTFRLKQCVGASYKTHRLKRSPYLSRDQPKGYMKSRSTGLHNIDAGETKGVSKSHGPPTK